MASHTEHICSRNAVHVPEKNILKPENVFRLICIFGTTNSCIFFFLHSWDHASLMYSSITNKMQRYTTVFITMNALHISGGSSAHHQELKTVHTALGI
jgi:hypothetical protein